MQIYFNTRSSLRQFAAKASNGKAVDNGSNAAKRWGFQINSKKG